MILLSAWFSKIFAWLSQRLTKSVRDQATADLRAEAAASAVQRRTAGEIAAEAAMKAQEQQEQAYVKMSRTEKLARLRRSLGHKRNTWML